MARLAEIDPDVSLEQAQAALAPMYAEAMRMTIDAVSADAGLRDFIGRFTFRVTSAAGGGISEFRDRFHQPLRILWWIVSLVLVIACVNMASLLGSRAIDRQREFAVRAALGAGRGRLVRQVFTESLILSSAGGLLGAGLARWAASGALRLGVGETGLRAIDLRPDSIVLLFAGLTSIAVGVVIGVGAVWRVVRTNPAEAWRTSLAARPRAFANRMLVASQIAIATVLVVVAALLVGSLVSARQVDPGFDDDHLVTLTIAPAMAGYTADTAGPYLRRVLDAIEALPGVRHATYHAVPIATGLVSQTGVTVAGFSGSAEETVAGQNRVGPGFAEALGLRVTAGRDLRAGDAVSASAALVNERFSRHFFGSVQTLGRTFAVGEREYSIVGIVTDAHDRTVRHKPEPWMYLASATADRRMQVTARVVGDPSSLPLERAVRAVDPAVPVFNARPVKEQIAETLRYERMLATFGAAFGALALGLVAIGVYAMFNGFVSRRSREIAIRMAVGGSRIEIVRLLTWDATVLVVCGLTVGVVGAPVAGRVLHGQLFDLEPTDGRALAAAAILMATVVAVAVWAPARRAIRMQPIRILRAG